MHAPFLSPETASRVFRNLLQEKQAEFQRQKLNPAAEILQLQEQAAQLEQARQLPNKLSPIRVGDASFSGGKLNMEMMVHNDFRPRNTVKGKWKGSDYYLRLVLVYWENDAPLVWVSNSEGFHFNNSHGKESTWMPTIAFSGRGGGEISPAAYTNQFMEVMNRDDPYASSAQSSPDHDNMARWPTFTADLGMSPSSPSHTSISSTNVSPSGDIQIHDSFNSLLPHQNQHQSQQQQQQQQQQQNLQAQNLQAQMMSTQTESVYSPTGQNNALSHVGMIDEHTDLDLYFDF
eukprot:TRINITY_DN1348_c2_g1_i1.p1 TRINITY_DN1348_c2_g1~~TRINITY_DN1348_c2_g1_i1.p1  ORF type:complete len:311 (+),score=57.03 TRINITY_DN1348_c2_g1_i1:67-933(+)